MGLGRYLIGYLRVDLAYNCAAPLIEAVFLAAFGADVCVVVGKVALFARQHGHLANSRFIPESCHPQVFALPVNHLVSMPIYFSPDSLDGVVVEERIAGRAAKAFSFSAHILSINLAIGVKLLGLAAGALPQGPVEPVVVRVVFEELLVLSIPEARSNHPVELNIASFGVSIIYSFQPARNSYIAKTVLQVYTVSIGMEHIRTVRAEGSSHTALFLVKVRPSAVLADCPYGHLVRVRFIPKSRSLGNGYIGSPLRHPILVVIKVGIGMVDVVNVSPIGRPDVDGHSRIDLRVSGVVDRSIRPDVPSMVRFSCPGRADHIATGCFEFRVCLLNHAGHVPALAIEDHPCEVVWRIWMLILVLGLPFCYLIFARTF